MNLTDWNNLETEKEEEEEENPAAQESWWVPLHALDFLVSSAATGGPPFCSADSRSHSNRPGVKFRR
jgi:hypothetical protein